MKDVDLKVLLIEDDEDDAILFKEAIIEINPGAEVTVLSEWKKVFSFIDKSNVMPHIIFMDYVLPGKRGSELAAELNKNEKLKNTPMVLCSGLMEPINVLEKAEFQEMMTKPSSYKNLVETLRKVFIKNIPVFKS